jgi:hypothetical protein
MRRAICILSLLLVARGAAAQQDTIPAAADSAAVADSIALVNELSAMQAQGGRDTVPASAGPVQRLLPDISVVGDLVADFSPEGSTQEGGERFLVREIEIAAGAAVDPYFRGDVFLGVSDEEGIAIEQAFLTTTALPAGVEVRLGRFLMPFARLNLTHREALHTVEFPWVYQRFLGPEGLKGTGVQASRVFAPFGFYQELLVTAVDGLGEPVEGLRTAEPINRRLGGLGYSARLRNYLDLSQASNVELGFSALTGERAQALDVPADAEVTAVARRQTTVGADFTYRWRPLQQGLYRSLIVQAEVMRQVNEDPGELVPPLPGGVPVDFLGPRRSYTGGFAFARYQLTRRSFLGARYDRVQDPQADGEALNAASAYLEFFPSEFTKLVASYERFEPGQGDGMNRILLQAVFALGPHKPHPF